MWNCDNKKPTDHPHTPCPTLPYPSAPPRPAPLGLNRPSPTRFGYQSIDRSIESITIMSLAHNGLNLGKLPTYLLKPLMEYDVIGMVFKVANKQTNKQTSIG